MSTQESRQCPVGSMLFVPHQSTIGRGKVGPLPGCLERPPEGAVASGLTDLVHSWEQVGKLWMMHSAVIGRVAGALAVVCGLELVFTLSGPWRAGLGMSLCSRELLAFLAALRDQENK